MELENLTKKELLDLINIIQVVLRDGAITQNPKNKLPSDHKSDLESLIGSIPFLLLNQEIFEKNQDIADFAKKLDITIPSPEKKKKEDIIGRIVSAISQFDKNKIKELNQIIGSLKISDRKRSSNRNEFKSSFFNEWDAAIKQMKI